MPQYAVATAFTAKDRITRTYQKMTRAAKMFGNQSDRSFRKASRAGKRFGDIVKGTLVSNVIQRGTAKLNEGLGIAARNFTNLDDAAMSAVVKFSDMSVEGEKLWKNLSIVKEVAREVGRTTEYTATQAAVALEFFARTNFKAVEAFKMIRSAADVATAAGEDFALVTDWTTDLLGGFQLHLGTVEQRIKNYAHLNDVLVKSANSANVTIETMFETFKGAASVGTAYGSSLEEIAALASVLGSNMRKGGVAATDLKNIYLRLSKPTEAVWRGLDMLNLSLDDLQDRAGAGKPIADVLDILNKGMQDLTRSERLAAMGEIGGAYAAPGLIIAASNVGEVRKRTKAYKEEAGGTAQKTANILRKSFGNQLKILGSALNSIADDFFQIFEADFRRILPEVITRTQESDIKPFVERRKEEFLAIKKDFSAVANWFRGGAPTAGTVDVNFKNAPAGTTAEATGDIKINPETMGVAP